jgi:hypothetical protein
MDTAVREEEIMTDYQFKTVLKMVRGVIKNADSLEQAQKEVDELIGETPTAPKKSAVKKKQVKS